MFDTQHDLTDRQGAQTRCHCAHSKAIDRYHSREAHKQYIWPRRMAINEHQLMDSSIGEGYAVVLIFSSRFTRRAVASPTQK